MSLCGEDPLRMRARHGGGSVESTERVLTRVGAILSHDRRRLAHLLHGEPTHARVRRRKRTKREYRIDTHRHTHTHTERERERESERMLEVNPNHWRGEWTLHCGNKYRKPGKKRPRKDRGKPPKRPGKTGKDRERPGR